MAKRHLHVLMNEDGRRVQGDLRFGAEVQEQREFRVLGFRV